MRLGTFLRIFVVAMLIVALGTWALLGFLLPGLARSFEAIVGSAWILVAAGLVALPCGICIDRGRRRRLMFTGLALDGAAAALWISMLWLWRAMNDDHVEFVLRIAGSLSAAAGFLAVIGMLHLFRTENRIALLGRRLTIAMAGLFAASIVLAIWWMDTLTSSGEERLAKTMGVLGVSTGCGVLITFLLMRLRQLEMSGDIASAEEDEVRLPFTLRCPRCDLRQDTETGGANCARCGLRITVSIP